MLSMTGFGSATDVSGNHEFTVECKSVNHKGLDIRIRGNVRPTVANQIEKLIASKVGRGHIEVYISYRAIDQSYEIDPGPLADVYAAAQTTLATLASMPSGGEIGLPSTDWMYSQALGIANSNKKSANDGGIDVPTDLVATALDQLCESRAAEGVHLATELKRIIDDIETSVSTIELERVGERDSQIEDIRKRLAQWNDLAPDMAVELHSEIRDAVIRGDVREETVRLRAHISRARHLNSTNDPIGREMTILCQEFHRESNTLAVKAVSEATKNPALHIKLLVEQLKEQVANVE